MPQKCGMFLVPHSSHNHANVQGCGGDDISVGGGLLCDPRVFSVMLIFWGGWGHGIMVISRMGGDGGDWGTVH